MTVFLSLLAACVQPPGEVNPARLSAWVADLSGGTAERKWAAYEALAKAGPKAKAAVPDLIKLLGGPDEAGVRKDHVAEILGAIGPDAKAAVPALVGVCTPSDYGFHLDTIALALVKIDGPKPDATRALLLSRGKCTPIILVGSQYLAQNPRAVVPHLVALCGDRDAATREKAATTLGTLKEDRGKAGKTLWEVAGDGVTGVPAALEKMLADDAVAVRAAAAAAVSNVAPELAEKAIAMVVAAGTDEKSPVRIDPYLAAQILRPVPGPAAKAILPLFDAPADRTRSWAIGVAGALPVQPQVEEALRTGKTARTREAAAVCLGSRYGSEPAAAALKGALADTAFAVRFAAAEGLVNIADRGSAAAAVPVLTEGLKPGDDGVRLRAGANLCRIGAAATAAVPDLKKLLADASPAVALEAALALVEIAPAAAGDAVPVLTRGLAAEDHPATRSARALAELGPAAAAAVPELVKKFGAKYVHLRIAAAVAAARIDPDQAGAATEVLVGVLKDKKAGKGMIRSSATAGLVRIGPGAKAAVPALLELLADDGDFHVDLALAAVAIDPEAGKPARAWMRSQLTTLGEDADDIADRLAALGASAKPFLSELVLMLKSKRSIFRENAVETLAAIGPDAKEALPLLKEIAATDPRPDLRPLAADAVKKIEER